MCCCITLMQPHLILIRIIKGLQVLLKCLHFALCISASPVAEITGSINRAVLFCTARRKQNPIGGVVLRLGTCRSMTRKH